MYLFQNLWRIAVLCFVSVEISSATKGERYRRDEKPKFPYDPNTTKYCSWWIDNDGSVACSAIPDTWLISLADFLRWVTRPQASDKLYCL